MLLRAWLPTLSKYRKAHRSLASNLRFTHNSIHLTARLPTPLLKVKLILFHTRLLCNKRVAIRTHRTLSTTLSPHHNTAILNRINVSRNQTITPSSPSLQNSTSLHLNQSAWARLVQP